MQIAGKLTIKDWNELVKYLKPECNENWGKAFQFFEQRVETRYIKPIGAIFSMGLDEGEGFAMVNLQCSLIETIESFYNGWIYKDCKYYITKNGKEELAKDINGEAIFRSFFSKRAPFNEKTSFEDKSFYKDVRCGLLHETQTKGNWVIRNSDEDSFFKYDGELKVINRNGFQKAIEKAINDYKEKIINPMNKELKENFIAKFNHICIVSKVI